VVLFIVVGRTNEGEPTTPFLFSPFLRHTQGGVELPTTYDLCEEWLTFHEYSSQPVKSNKKTTTKNRKKRHPRILEVATKRKC
jgi:hypothetical protein